MDATTTEGKLDVTSLEETLLGAQRELLRLGELDGELVKTQVAKAACQQKIWETRQLLAEIDGNHSVAKDCSTQAHRWSEQQTRALKQSHADRLAKLEEELANRGARRTKLKAV